MLRKHLLLALLMVCSHCANPQKTAAIAKDTPYLLRLNSPDEFDLFKGAPLASKYAQVDAVKVVWDTKKSKLYFINHAKSSFHYEFCASYLGYKDGLEKFNTTEYGPDRRFILANINHHKAKDIYVLEFFTGDRLRAEEITLTYQKIQENAFFKSNFFVLYDASGPTATADIAQVKTISVDDLFGHQRYQPMVDERSYGYLRKVDKAAFDQYPFTTQDIILTDFLPNDMPYCQGILTTAFQTPLSHINVLSHNRKTPNCAYKAAFTDEHINQLVGKLVYYEVKQDTFYLKEATLEVAKIFWNKQKGQPKRPLRCNLKERQLLDTRSINRKSVPTFGGKAANFGEMEQIQNSIGVKIPLPEASFAIPFYYYAQHIQQHRLQPMIDVLLRSDSIAYNRTLLEKHLKILHDSIINSPLDAGFLTLLTNKLNTFSKQYTDFRFRSSTNAEDIEGFTGAGLYTSKTGSLTNPDKSVEKAVKKVWASLWTVRAFEERLHANIDQSKLAMGILVHRSFGEEAANGVAITKNLYRENYPGYTINIQMGEVSVVQPENGVMPEQLLIKPTYLITREPGFAVDYLAHSAMNNYQPILTTEEINELARYLEAIKKHFYHASGGMVLGDEFLDFAMDVEFKLDRGTRKIYIKQARPYN